MRISIILSACLLQVQFISHAGNTQKMTSVSISTDGKRVVSASPNEVILWDMAAKKEIARESFKATYVSIIPGNKVVVAGSQGIRLYSSENLSLIDSVQGAVSQLTGPYVVTTNGNYLFCRKTRGPKESFLHAIDLSTLKSFEAVSSQNKKLFNDDVRFTVSSDNRFLYMLTGGFILQQFSIADSKTVGEFTVDKVHTEILRANALAAGKEYLYLGSNCKIGSSGKEISRYLSEKSLMGFGVSKLDEGITAMAYSQALQAVFVATLKKKIYVMYDTEGKVKKLASIDRFIQWMEVSADGRYLAIATGFGDKGNDDFPTIVLDAVSGKKVAELK
ncbi:MAG: hypothetical protein ACK40M_01325 [Flavobacteriales bacterium]